MDERAIGPWNVHRLLVANSLSGWMSYMAWLEETLNEQVKYIDDAMVVCQLTKFGREQSDLIISAKVGAEKESLSPLLDFKFNFIDRQSLKIVEDYVIDLQIILPTLLGNIVGIHEQCKAQCKIHQKDAIDTCDCALILSEFDEHAREAECCIKRADALREKARSIAQLVSLNLCFRTPFDKNTFSNMRAVVRSAKLRGCNNSRKGSSGNTERKQVIIPPNGSCSEWR